MTDHGRDHRILVEELRRRREELARQVAVELGFGPLPGMRKGLRRRLDEEVDFVLDAWRRSGEGGQKPLDAFQRLLAEVLEAERKVRRSEGP